MAFVLVIDDDEADVELICNALRGAGHEAQPGGQGPRALQALNARAPDILVTDMLMPEVDGIDMIMQARRTCPRIRILAVSARRKLHHLDVLHLAEQLGADCTLEKPFSADELLVKIAGLDKPI